MTREVGYRVGIDIGGTFTDLVLAGDDGSLRTMKLPSTPDDYGRGIGEGLRALMDEHSIAADAITRVVHATTVATNAILEGKGARTALITTQGFRDVLEMRRLRIPEMYTLNYQKPDPLVPRRRRLEVVERLGPEGEVRVPLDEESVRAVAERIADDDIEALAISLLHAYANPVHERRVAAIVREIVGPEVFISCSSDILPVIREYERTSTTVINAYLGPALRHYLNGLRRHLEALGIAAPLQIMKSDGGIMSVEMAAERPAYLVESGPAAGVIGAAHATAIAEAMGCISLDMGGTTAKASIVEGGKVAKTGDYEVGAGINLSSKLVMGGGYALKLPVIDISEIGAGGGSIVSIDAGGLMRVGPESAGADPGPVAYDMGGMFPTFTDAAITLGYLNPDYLVGGALKLNADKARSALAAQIAEPLDTDLLDCAYGVYRVACGTMVRAVKAVSTYRGRDPRDFALFTFGGNGPVVAAAIADLLEMKRVIVPPNPGVFSAYGLLQSDIEHEVLQAFLARLSETGDAAFVERFRAIESQLTATMREEGYEAADYTIARFADLRYSGQAHELTIAVDAAPNNIDFTSLARAFGDEHERTYGHQAETEEVESVAIRIVATVAVDKTFGVVAPGTNEEGRRAAFFGPDHGLVEVDVLGRAGLGKGSRAGPLIIEEYDATCIVPPNWAAALDDDGNIILTRGGA
jgi:N-methylhydantoinase A